MGPLVFLNFLFFLLINKKIIEKEPIESLKQKMFPKSQMSINEISQKSELIIPSIYSVLSFCCFDKKNKNEESFNKVKILSLKALLQPLYSKKRTSLQAIITNWSIDPSQLEVPTIDYSMILFLEKLGKGGDGKVQLAYDKITNEFIAVKQFKKQNPEHNFSGISQQGRYIFL